jgi:hypothetical protein
VAIADNEDNKLKDDIPLISRIGKCVPTLCGILFISLPILLHCAPIECRELVKAIGLNEDMLDLTEVDKVLYHWRCAISVLIPFRLLVGGPVTTFQQAL